MSTNKRLELQKSALEYLDQSGVIASLPEKCLFYSGVQDKAFQFCIPVDATDIMEMDSNLGNMILNQPTSAARFFQEVLYTTFKTLGLLPECEAQSQVVVAFKINRLPDLPQYQLGNSSRLSEHAPCRGFIQYEGVVTGRSTVHKYTKSARYMCPCEGCEGAHGNNFIRLHIPGAREEQTIRSDFQCIYCRSPLVEDMSCRVLADRLVVELVVEAALTDMFAGKTSRHQGLTVYLRDELGDGVEIGQLLRVVGMPVSDPQHSTLALDANTITHLIEKESPSCQLSPTGDIPSTIAHLMHDRRGSPWSFPLSMAYALGGDITPAGTYLSLKLGLLLSLARPPTQVGGGLDVLAVGRAPVGRVLRHAAVLGGRALCHTTTGPLTAAPSRHSTASAATFIQGGSMMLAHGGVCLLPDLNTLKKSVKYSLLQALETGQVVVEVGGGAPLVLRRQCALWAWADPAPTAGPSRRATTDLLDPSDRPPIDLGGKDVMDSLAEVFGMVYYCDVDADSYADHLLSHHALLAAMATPQTPLIKTDEFIQFLSVVRRAHPAFTPAAARLIRGYYVGSRRVRGQARGCWSLPVSAVTTITNLATAHAQLCLSREVTEWDAVMAVYLFEESVTHRTGHSVLGVRPVVHVEDNDIQAYVGPKRDKQLMQFYNLLQILISTHAPDIHHVTEE